MPALLCPEKNVKENYSNFQLNSVKDSCIDKSSEFAKIRFLALLKFSFFTAVFQQSFSEELSSGKPVYCCFRGNGNSCNSCNLFFQGLK